MGISNGKEGRESFRALSPLAPCGVSPRPGLSAETSAVSPSQGWVRDMTVKLWMGMKVPRGGHLNRGLSRDGDDWERWGARSRQKGRCWVCTDVGESDEVGL